jgi:glycosyltransferase involved in cell wall biosynthesis
VFKSKSESRMFEEYFCLPSGKVRHISLIADAAYLKPAPKGLFKTIYGLDQYILAVGIIEPIKNQLTLIKAIKETSHQLVLVGGYRDRDYFAACKSAGGDKVLFIDALPAGSELMRSAMAESQAFVECSYEPPGLSAIEAGLTGTSIVVSESAWSQEHFGSLVNYCNPADPYSIKQAINSALSQESSAKRHLKEHLMPLCEAGSIGKLVGVLQEVCV